MWPCANLYHSGRAASTVVVTAVAVVRAVVMAVVMAVVVVGERVTESPGGNGTCRRRAGIHRLDGTALCVIGGHATHAGTAGDYQRQHDETAGQ